MRETPLATSICAHVILQDEFVEINDTLDDPRDLIARAIAQAIDDHA